MDFFFDCSFLISNFFFQAANPDEMRDHKLDLIGAKAWIRIAMRLGNKV